MVSTSTSTSTPIITPSPTHNNTTTQLDRPGSQQVEQQSRTTIPESPRTLSDVWAAASTTTDAGSDCVVDIDPSQDEGDLPENKGDPCRRLGRLGKRKASASSVERGGRGRSAAVIAIATGTETVVRRERPSGKRQKAEIVVELPRTPTINKDDFILITSSQLSSQVSQEQRAGGASTQSIEIPSSLPSGSEQYPNVFRGDSEYVPSQESSGVQVRPVESLFGEENEHDTITEIPESLRSGSRLLLADTASDDRASQAKGSSPGLLERALTTTRQVPSLFHHVILQYDRLDSLSQRTGSSRGNSTAGITASKETHTWWQAASCLSPGSVKAAISQNTIPDSQESLGSAAQLHIETSIVLPSSLPSPTKQPDEHTEQYRQVDPLELSSEGLPSGPGSTRGTSAPQSPSPSPSQVVVISASTTASARVSSSSSGGGGGGGGSSSSNSVPANSSESKAPSDGYLTQEPFSHPLFSTSSSAADTERAVADREGSQLQDAQVLPGAPCAEGSQGGTNLLPESVTSRSRSQSLPQSPQLFMDQPDVSMADHSASPSASSRHPGPLAVLQQHNNDNNNNGSTSHSLPHRRASLTAPPPNDHTDIAFDLDTSICATKMGQPSASTSATDSGFDILSFYAKEEERGRMEMVEKLAKASRSQPPKSPSHDGILPILGAVPPPAAGLYQTVAAGALKTNNWVPDSVAGSIDPRNIFAGPSASQTSVQDSLLERATSHTEPAVPTETAAPRSYLVTLPFVSGRRAVYIDVLKANSKVAEAFSGTFEYVDKWPDAALVRSVDELFGKLLNICDFTGSDFTVRPGENEQRFRMMVMKHAIDSNTKFAFANLLMEQLAGRKILVVARTRGILNIYESMSQSLSPGPEVTLLLSEKEPPKALSYFDLIIAHDSKFKASPTAAALASKPSEHALPATISLVLEYGIDHLLDHMHRNLVRPSMPELERKNGLLYMLSKSMSMLTSYDNSPLSSFHALQEAAIQLARQVTSPSENFAWTGVPIPGDWLDCYADSAWTSPSGQPHEEEDPGREPGRKRKLDDEATESAKRAKFINDLHQPVIPDDVSTLLQLDAPEGETDKDQMISIPIAQLQAWVKRITDVPPEKLQKDVADASREVISRLEKQVGSYESTYKLVAERYQDAIFERSEFESKADNANKQLNAAGTRIRALEDEVQTLKTRLDASQTASQSPPAQPDEALRLQVNDANVKNARLEKKVSTAEKEIRFLRERYQDTDNEKNKVAAERDALAQEAKLLRSRDHAVGVQRKHTDSQTAKLLHQLRIKEYEAVGLRQDLGKMQERLAQEFMFRNSTRQTRQGSVPRSPAQRPVRGGMSIPGGNGGGNGSGSSGHTSSRGVSPVTAVDHPRYSRLKD